MSLAKKAKDQLLKLFWGKDSVPRGLFELQHYFRVHGPIEFRIQEAEGERIAVSQNFRYGSIVTSGKSEAELRRNIQDAVLTSFEIPSSFAKEADTKVQKVGERRELYAAA